MTWKWLSEWLWSKIKIKIKWSGGKRQIEYSCEIFFSENVINDFNYVLCEIIYVNIWNTNSVKTLFKKPREGILKKSGIEESVNDFLEHPQDNVDCFKFGKE